MNTFVIRVSVVITNVINNSVPNNQKCELFVRFYLGLGLIVYGRRKKDYKVTIEF